MGYDPQSPTPTHGCTGRCLWCMARSCRGGKGCRVYRELRATALDAIGDGSMDETALLERLEEVPIISRSVDYPRVLWDMVEEGILSAELPEGCTDGGTEPLIYRKVAPVEVSAPPEKVYYGGPSAEWLEEIAACKSIEEAAAEYASMHGLGLGDEFYISCDPKPNEEHDPDWPTGEENPEFYLTGPTVRFVLKVERAEGVARG